MAGWHEMSVMDEQGSLHSLVFHALQEQIAVIDQTGIIVEVNAAWVAFGKENGITPEYVAIGSNYLEVFSGPGMVGDELAAEAAQGLGEVLQGQHPFFEFEYPCHSPQQPRWFMMRVDRLHASPQALFVVTHHDITQRKLAEERVEQLARHDPLTGLANRRYFNEFLQQELHRCTRNQLTFSLLLIDVDHFKGYNDEFGHPEGDQCLLKVSGVIRHYARRAGALAARLGGDEFAIVLGETDAATVAILSAALLREVGELNLTYGGGAKKIGMSLGAVSVVPQIRQQPQRLLEAADRALYRAKRAGGNRLVSEDTALA